MELDGFDELRRMGTGILEFMATLGDESEIWSMEDDRGSLLVEFSLEFEGIVGNIGQYDLVSIPCATLNVAPLKLSVSEFSVFWNKTTF